MSTTPKLKVYRLDSNYSAANDNDIQYFENDELLPVSVKKLNPWNTEVMVGVESKSDARLVQESNENYYVDLNMAEEGGIVSTYKTESCYCDDWVLGQENLYVYVKKNKSGQTSSSSSSESGNITRDNMYESEGWYRIPSNWFRFGILKEKVFYDVNGITTNINNAIGFTYAKRIYIELGNQLFFGTSSDVWWNDEGYTNFDAVEQVRIGYKIYHELGESGLNNFYKGNLVATPPKIRVPFDNIYNGNKTGRIKVDNDYDTADVYSDDKSILEGNYFYRRSIYPLRFKIATVNLTEEQLENLQENQYSKDNLVDSSIDGYNPVASSKYVSDYVRDTILTKHGSVCSCTFNGTLNWIIDGDAKPVLMERRRSFNKDGLFTDNYIFVQIDEGTQINDLKPELSASGVKYKVTFIPNFYQTATSKYAFPNEVFLMFNESDDRIEGEFDFNYDYARKLSYADEEETISLGLNTGHAVVSENAKTFNTSSFYKKSDLIAVKRNYGYVDGQFLLLNEVENSGGWIDLRLTIPKRLTLNGKTNDISLFNRTGEGSGHGGGIYYKGNKIWDGSNLTSDYNVNWIYDSSNEQYTITIHPTGSDIPVPEDVMVVYYEIHDVGFKKIQTFEFNETQTENVSPSNETESSESSESSEGSESSESSESSWNEESEEESSSSSIYDGATVIDERNPWCYGYRVVCYQKVKNSNLFVSSFPNWVKDHLNNNVDVFIGNTLYSGTDTTNFASDGIYPNYQKSGYAVNYTEGSVHFTDPIDQLDYNDIRNFAAQINSNISIDNNTTDNDLRIYYQKVRANYAYYNGLFNIQRARLSCYTIQDGGFWYALLEDDYFKDSIGKRIVMRKDNYIRMLFESGTESLPKVQKSNPNQKEILTMFEEFKAKPRECVKVNTTNNRVTCINYTPDSTNYHGIVILNKSYTGKTAIETNLNNLNDNDDIRIHITVDRNNVFNVGLVAEDNTITNNEFVQKVDWVPLPDTDDIYEGMTLEDVYDNEIQRWTYTNESWFYDVIFEIFSYRYKTAITDRKRNILNSVEFLVYKIDKE